MEMQGIWLVSYLVLWCVTLLLIVAMFALARQIGLLHRRIVPSGAMTTNEGLKIGDAAPVVEGTNLNGGTFTLGGQRLLKMMIAFVSPNCGACHDLVPALKAMRESQRETIELIVVGMGGSEPDNREYISRYKLHKIPYLHSEEIARQYKVFGPPFAILVDEDGLVRAKGTVNHLEHLQSLINAMNAEKPGEIITATAETALPAHDQPVREAVSANRVFAKEV